MISDFETIKRNAFIYEPVEGFVIIAGRTSKDNDFISVKVAAPEDYWFHVRGMPGSHVLLRSLNGEEPDKRLQETAAAVAAWHSKGRNGGVTAVSMTKAKFVSKPGGVKDGTVYIKNEKVLKVRPGLPEES
ncbi:MAG TPA: NFACT RNA binding domain-containing protein [Candidatus Rifleibacterium sp.]|nr:NFACT RNA binding domain-containing protein [Candidatus Rifleibacterium sp.]HPT48281.1 NFACT RNA binding domain-containing protein [Candidatus Rifleibacterium sp.]